MVGVAEGRRVPERTDIDGAGRLEHFRGRYGHVGHRGALVIPVGGMEAQDGNPPGVDDVLIQLAEVIPTGQALGIPMEADGIEAVLHGLLVLFSDLIRAEVVGRPGVQVETVTPQELLMPVGDVAKAKHVHAVRTSVV